MRVLLLALLLLPAAAAAQPASAEIRPTGMRYASEGFELNTRVVTQFKLTVQDERGNGSNGTDGRDFANFRARVRLSMEGHIFEPRFQYRVQLNFALPVAEMVEIAKFSFHLGPALSLHAGQDRLPWDWERRVPVHTLGFIDFGYVNEVFNQDWGKGLWAQGSLASGLSSLNDAPDTLRYWAGVYNGVMRADNDFRNRDGTQSADSFSRFVDGEMMFNARLEGHLGGIVEQSAGDWRPEETRGDLMLAAGAGVNWFSSGFNDGLIRGDTAIVFPASGRPRTQQETWAFTADAHLRWHGASLDVAVYYRMTEFHNRGSNRFRPHNKAGISDLTDFGWSLEVGYIILPNELGAFVRVSSLDADEFWGSDGIFSTEGKQRAIRPDATEVGVAVNYLVHGPRLKLAMDINYVNEQLAFAYNGSNRLLGVYSQPMARRGALGSNPRADDNAGTWIVRFQLQWIL